MGIQSIEALTPESKIQQPELTPDKSDQHFHFVNPFIRKLSGSKINTAQKKAVELTIHKDEITSLFESNNEFVSLSVPSFDEQTLTLELYRVELLTEDFVVRTSGMNEKVVEVPIGHFYRGVVKNDPSSIAAFSIFQDEIIGMVTMNGENIVLKPAEDKVSYLLYNDKDQEIDVLFTCNSLDHPERRDAPQTGETPEESKCVKVYIECDYALHQNKGGTTNTVNWITAVYNNVATLYANENISTVISEIFVWSTPDSYSKTSSYNALIQFRNTRRTYNGDLAHLAALGGRNIGGIAWLDALCSSYGYAYSNISSSYRSVPSYSWTVEVMTHEMGHSLGSNHTHWCGWPGGAIDNCYTPEGGCSRGPAPRNGGTVMSYCHLTSYGINFNNGFGTHPGDKIRSEVAAAVCLSASCGGGGGGGGCSTPSGVTASNITQTSALVSWNSVSGASSYNLEYRINGTTTWTQINTTSTSYTLGGLAMSTTYNTRVKAICSSGSSAYSTTVNFTTKGVSKYCTSKGNSSSREWISRVKTGTLDRSSGSDNGYYDGTHLSTDMTKGQSNLIYFTAGRTGSSRRFYWRIWVDLNNNGSFNDAGELRISGYSNSTGLLYSWLYVPTTASNGPTRMRVAMKYGGYPGSCEVFSRGEVEDYTVNIVSSGSLESGSEIEAQDEGLKKMKVYPNPSYGTSQLEFYSVGEKTIIFTMSDLNGRVVKQWSTEAVDGHNFVDVEMDDLVRGSYFIRADSGYDQKVIRLMKM
jgi:hypothetical protein